MVEADLKEPAERNVGGAAVRHEHRGVDASLGRNRRRRVEARDYCFEVSGRNFELPDDFVVLGRPVRLELPQGKVELDGVVVG